MRTSPLPSWPPLLKPVHQMEPSSRSKQVSDELAAILMASETPVMAGTGTRELVSVPLPN
jgi:hypothetical protein